MDLEIATLGVGAVRSVLRWLVYGVREFVGVVSAVVLADASHASLPLRFTLWCSS
ncbi:hypothetical protein GYA89_25825 [Rhodococcus qingshengii]|nr:hypothetical protein [Rhodococcus qingshengii]